MERPYLDNLRAITQVIGPAASRADSAIWLYVARLKPCAAIAAAT
jgi:hypothetical protein